MAKVVLITGGARSGKSTYGQQLAEAYAGPRLFIATAVSFDEELAERIEKHRRSRERAAWTTVEEPTDLTPFWSDDLVSFLIGCSFTFESALIEAGLPVRHVEQCTNVPMYITSIPTVPAGAFHGPTVVSMRPIPAGQVVRAVQVTSRFPAVHGAPIQIGDPAAIGIRDITRPDLGDPVEIRAGEVPVFWACGVTPQAVAMASKPRLMLTHSPGHMFITDRRDAEFAVL